MQDGSSGPTLERNRAPHQAVGRSRLGPFGPGRSRARTGSCLVDPARPLGRPRFQVGRGRSPTSSCRKVWSRNRASPVCWPGVGQHSTLGSRLVAVAALVALDVAGIQSGAFTLPLVNSDHD